MKTIMISQPMANKTDEQIINAQQKFKSFVDNNGYQHIDTFFKDDFKQEVEKSTKNVPLHFLSKSIQKMSLCDAVYFAKDFENARGCKIEHEIAKAYGLEIFYEQ